MSIFDTEPKSQAEVDPEALPDGISADGEITEEADADRPDEMKQLRQDVDDLANLVGEMVAKGQDTDGEADSWCWRHLDEPARGKLWIELRTWVDWFNGRYGVTEKSRIPGCWFRHPVVVEELTALWVAWRYAYIGQGEPNDSPAYWHERLLWPTLDRITSQPWGLGKCRAGHTDPVNIPLGPSTDEDFNEYTGAGTAPAE